MRNPNPDHKEQGGSVVWPQKKATLLGLSVRRAPSRLLRLVDFENGGALSVNVSFNSEFHKDGNLPATPHTETEGGDNNRPASASCLRSFSIFGIYEKIGHCVEHNYRCRGSLLLTTKKF